MTLISSAKSFLKLTTREIDFLIVAFDVVLFVILAMLFIGCAMVVLYGAFGGVQ